MRERLTIWFTLLTVGIVAGALLIRTHSLEGDLRAHEAADLRREVGLVRIAVEDRVALGGDVDAAFLDSVVGPGLQLVFVDGGGQSVRATGRSFAPRYSPDSLMLRVFSLRALP